jgi:hypothetical protein
MKYLKIIKIFQAKNQEDLFGANCSVIQIKAESIWLDGILRVYYHPMVCLKDGIRKWLDDYDMWYRLVRDLPNHETDKIWFGEDRYPIIAIEFRDKEDATLFKITWSGIDE